jgi:hypothetical protein
MLNIFLPWAFFFALGCPGTVILLISASCIAVMTGVHHCAQLLVGMGSSLLFCLGWSPAVILVILASQVARITGMIHQCQQIFIEQILMSDMALGAVPRSSKMFGMELECSKCPLSK